MKIEKHVISYNILKYLLSIFFITFYRPKIINKKVIPKHGPIIICGNHQHLFDQNLVCISTKRMVHYLAKIEYFKNKKVSWFFHLAGCIPVDRNNKDENAKREAIRLLNQNYAIGIFPEGTRNKTDKFLLPFKYGSVSLAQKTNATIVPFAITGKYKIFNNHLNIRYGTPFKVPKNMPLEEANKILFNEIERLKKEGLKDIKKGAL